MEREAFLARLAGAAPGPALPDLTTLPAVHTELRPGDDALRAFPARAGGRAGHLRAVRARRRRRGRRGGARRRPARRAGRRPRPAPGAGARRAGGGGHRGGPLRRGVFGDRERLGALEATVTGCALAVAATGSIVTTAPAGRAAALIAPLHVCVVASATLVGGLAEALRRLPASSMAAFQSGPSRTADIEKKLILGMHGPGVTHVIVA